MKWCWNAKQRSGGNSLGKKYSSTGSEPPFPASPFSNWASVRWQRPSGVFVKIGLAVFVKYLYLYLYQNTWFPAHETASSLKWASGGVAIWWWQISWSGSIFLAVFCISVPVLMCRGDSVIGWVKSSRARWRRPSKVNSRSCLLCVEAKFALRPPELWFELKFLEPKQS